MRTLTPQVPIHTTIENSASAHLRHIFRFQRFLDPIRKENFNPPRDFKLARVHGQINSVEKQEYCPAFEAFEKGDKDMRPHLYEVTMDQFLLIDSGAQVSAVPPDPEDTIDPSMSLRAVNGDRINCYGTKTLDIKIGRKTYQIEVIKSDVKSPILGWNFIRKHRLSFEWNAWGDICLVDKKADIRAVMHYKPHFQNQIKAFESEPTHSDTFDKLSTKGIEYRSASP